jgi:hypothetical protein
MKTELIRERKRLTSRMIKWAVLALTGSFVFVYTAKGYMAPASLFAIGLSCVLAMVGATVGWVLDGLALWKNYEDGDAPPAQRLPVYEQTSAPAPVRTVRFEYSDSKRQTRLKKIELDMDDVELREFILAIRHNRDVITGEMVMTKRLLKDATGIQNIDERYKTWWPKLEAARAIKKRGVTYHITETGKEIFNEWLPPTP